MSLEEKILALQEKARELEEAKCKTESSDMEDEGSAEDEIEDEDETKASKKEMAVAEGNIYDKHLAHADKLKGKIKDALASGDVALAKQHAKMADTPGHRKDLMGMVRDHQKKTMQEEVEQKIDLGELFDGVDLTEEFKTKAMTIFEAAVAARVKQEVEQMEESLAQRAIDESVELKEGLVDKVDGYLDYMVEQWIKNNEIALERGIKAEIFESFIGKMRDVFVEHNINLPDEEFDLVESLQDKAEALEQALDEQVAQNVELGKTLKTIAKQMQIEEAAKGMTDIDAEKFALLAEEIAFEDAESFGKKLVVIRENYVQDKSAPKETKQLTEDVTIDSNAPVVELTEEVKVDPTMARYLSAFIK